VSGKELADLLYQQQRAGCGTGIPAAGGGFAKKLFLYSATEGQKQKWCCLLPDGVSGLGYKLGFINQWRLPDPTVHFSQALREGGVRPIVVFTAIIF
jgi:hypothetical protein